MPQRQNAAGQMGAQMKGADPSTPCAGQGLNTKEHGAGGEQGCGGPDAAGPAAQAVWCALLDVRVVCKNDTSAAFWKSCIL